MTSTELIQNVSEVLKAKATYPAFSFFFRIHSGSEKQLHDSGHIRNKVHEVLKESNLSPSTLEELRAKADELIDKLSFETGALSVGLFVSPSESFLTQYHVNLPERNYLADYFSGYETTYADQESAPYLFMLLEPSTLRIYRGRGDHFETLPESDASKHLMSVYRRRPPAPRDKDGKERKEYHDPEWKKDFLEAIAGVCCSEQLPVYFAGTSLAGLNETELASHGIEVLLARDEVSHCVGSEKLRTLVKDLRSTNRAMKSKLLYEKCKAAKGNQKFASGPDEVLTCAKEGRGEVLVLPYPCWESTGTLQLGTLHEAIRATDLTNGRTEFLPGELMKEWDDIAMILRY